jgi:hypothetical protein
MAGIETKIREAKQAGYSDAEIVEFLAQTPDVGPQIATALENQYKPEEIIGFLSGADQPTTIGREAGLAVRPVAQAVLTAGGMLPMVVDPLVNLYNLATDSSVPTMTRAVDTTLTAAGFPQPRTGTERVVQDVASAGYGTAGLARGVSRFVEPALQSNLGREVAKFFSTSPTAQTSAAAAASAGGGVLREGEFSPATQLGGAMVAGMIAPGGPTLSTTQRALAAPKGLVQPFTQSGREVIAGNVLRKVATDPERAIANLQQARSTVPGVRVTTAAGARDPGLAGAETTMRSALFDPSNQFGGVLSANQQALMEAYRRISGQPGSIPRAETKRASVTAPMRESAFANAQPVSIAPIMQSIEATMADPAKQRQTVDQSMKYVTDLLAKRADPQTGAINPMALYSIRKDIGLAMQGQLAGDAANLRLAKGELKALLPVIDDVIESGAPGFKNYMQQFEKSSSAIDQMRVLQDIEGRVTTGQPNLMTGQPVLAASALRRQVASRADEMDTKLSDAAQRRINNIIFEINRGQASTAPGVRAPGSNTFQNMSMGNMIGRVLSESMADNTTLRTMTRPLDWLYKLPDQQVQQLLVEAMLDPQLAATLMSKANMMKVEPFSKSLRKKAEQLGFGTAIGAAQSE